MPKHRAMRCHPAPTAAIGQGSVCRDPSPTSPWHTRLHGAEEGCEKQERCPSKGVPGSRSPPAPHHLLRPPPQPSPCPFPISSQPIPKAPHCDGKKSPSSGVIARPPDPGLEDETDLAPPLPPCAHPRPLWFVTGLGQPCALPVLLPLPSNTSLLSQQRLSEPRAGVGADGASLKGSVSEQIASL